MQLLDVSVLDGRGLITIAVRDIKDRIRLQDYFREAEILFSARDEVEGNVAVDKAWDRFQNAVADDVA